MTKITRKVRLAQLIGPFGPGAIIDMMGESFVAEDASRWRNTRTIAMPRLAARLGVPELHSPSDFPGVPYLRFPTWLFCRRCRRMSRHHRSMEQRDRPPMCAECPDLALVPMRFVAVCSNGHLTDIPWEHWAHKDAEHRDQRQCGDKSKLYFVSHSDRGSGLESLEIKCDRCGASQDLQKITSKGAIHRKCTGEQPWQYPQDHEGCDKPLVGTQRGASNVYFPEVVSALDLPPESDWDQYSLPTNRLRSKRLFQVLLEDPRIPARDALIEYLATAEGFTNDEVEQALEAERSASTNYQDIGSEADIAPEEWHALTEPKVSDYDHRDHFITRRAPHLGSESSRSLPPRLANLLAEVVLVDRLREVRVLKGFRRFTAERMVSSNLAEDKEFLPAVEVFGEGFFLAFDEDAIQSWESQEDVRAQLRPLQGRVQRTNLHWLPAVSARYIMLHSLAHLLLRSTAFDAGYPVSALRERVYATAPDDGPDMAGILIYTAAGDAEGTLGGLARMGEPERLTPLFMNSVTDAQWCSLDPVCRESTSQGPGGLSLAACHACTLLPETSCQAGNRLLDRNLLIHPEFGFLAPLAAENTGLPGRGTW